LAQVNVKRMLAYSSIAHAGYLLVAIVSNNETATAGLLFYLLVYSLMNIGALGIVLTVGDQGEKNQEINDFAGFGWRQPVLGVFLTIFLLSLAGFPGTGGFMGKIFLLQGAMDASLVYLSTILVLTTVVSYWYYLRVAWFMWMREAPNPEAHVGLVVPFALRLALIVGVVVVLYTGIFPGATLELARAGAESLTAAGLEILGAR